VVIYYTKKAFEILRVEGIIELAKISIKFVRGLISNQCGLIRNQLVTKSDLLWEYQIRKATKQVANQTDADPFKIIWVDPKQIQYVSGNIKYNLNADPYHLERITSTFSFDMFGGIEDGDWDINNDEFTGISEYNAIKQRYENCIPWQETDYFKRHLKRIEKFGCSRNCHDKEELLEACERYENLLYEIKKDGFKTQREHGKSTFYDEISVNIGRTGEFLLRGSRHRLSIAKVLEIEQIPIIVRVRHKLWQELRDEFQNNGFNDDRANLRDHPDLQDIINK